VARCFPTHARRFACLLGKVAAGLDLLVFDLGCGRYVAVRASAAAPGSWRAALEAGTEGGADATASRVAAECLLANIHTAGWRGLVGSSAFWQTYGDTIVKAVEVGGLDDRRIVASFVAEFLVAVPAPFRHSPLLLRRVLAPIVYTLAEELSVAASFTSQYKACQACLHVAGLLLNVDSWVNSLKEHLTCRELGASEEGDEDAECVSDVAVVGDEPTMVEATVPFVALPVEPAAEALCEASFMYDCVDDLLSSLIDVKTPALLKGVKDVAVSVPIESSTAVSSPGSASTVVPSQPTFVPGLVKVESASIAAQRPKRARATVT